MTRQKVSVSMHGFDSDLPLTRVSLLVTAHVLLMFSSACQITCVSPFFLLFLEYVDGLLSSVLLFLYISDIGLAHLYAF